MSTFGDMLLRNAIGTNVYNRIPSRLRNLDRLARSLGADVDFDFTSGVLDSRLTYARNDNVGTRFNSSGVLETLSANQPRFDHDPDTLEALGILIEESRENLVTNSSSIASWGSAQGATQDLDSHAAPDGTTTGDTITFAAIANSQYALGFTLTAASYTMSVYARSLTGTKQFRLKYWNGSTDAFSSNFTATTSWQRFTFVITGAAAVGDIAIVNASGADAGSIVVWGIQLELGAFATSYIPTAGATAQRQADALSCTGTNFSSWYRQDAGTFLIDCLYGLDESSYVLNVFLNGTDHFAVRSTSATWLLAAIRKSGESAADIPKALSHLNTALKIGLGYAASNAAMCVNGGSVGTSSPAALAANTSLSIGSGFGDYTNSHIKSVKYWRQRIPDAALQVLTS